MKGLKKPKTALIAIVVVGGLIALALLFRSINQPAEGAIKTVAAPQSSEPKTHLITVRGKTASFKYPSDLESRKPEPLSPTEVEKFAFVRRSTLSWNLNVQILRAAGLSDDGSYNLRRVHPEQYSEQKMAVNGLPVFIMSDTTAPFSKVAFMAHNGLVAEVALTSGDAVNTDQLQQTLMTVVQSWQWL